MAKLWFCGIIFITALYFGSGGYIILQNEQLYEKAQTLEKNEVVYKGVTFYNKETMIAAREQDLIIRVYPYAMKIPSFLSFLLTAVSFGIIGALGKVINDTLQKNVIFKETPNLLLVPIQGGIIGIIILGVSYAIPIILTNENVSLKPISIVFLSLFGGIFYMNFYEWFTSVIDRILFIQDDNTNP
ncbi:hypothetical protein [Cyclobacterium jeungdonense]|uniref:MotA/TolQ/ExbB proton channel family protein n=1 Tax=Cyclobacterium jeungdonense TaxID=708087 RepID=A0ABT8C967_9BACT|nr:hypothetical protein [Cyclobacterium jeungdonense]MDN3689348.1 hypothetical protein [Cyclobacterium jeungdonense]